MQTPGSGNWASKSFFIHTLTNHKPEASELEFPFAKMCYPWGTSLSSYLERGPQEGITAPPPFSTSVTVYLFILFLYPHFRDSWEVNMQRLEQNTYRFPPSHRLQEAGRVENVSQSLHEVSSSTALKSEEAGKGSQWCCASFSLIFFFLFSLGIYIGRHQERKKEESFTGEVAIWYDRDSLYIPQ